MINNLIWAWKYKDREREKIKKDTENRIPLTAGQLTQCFLPNVTKCNLYHESILDSLTRWRGKGRLATRKQCWKYRAEVPIYHITNFPCLKKKKKAYINAELCTPAPKKKKQKKKVCSYFAKQTITCWLCRTLLSTPGFFFGPMSLWFSLFWICHFPQSVSSSSALGNLAPSYKFKEIVNIFLFYCIGNAMG